MGYKMFKSAQAAGMEFMDTHHELESNDKVRAEMIRRAACSTRNSGSTEDV